MLDLPSLAPDELVDARAAADALAGATGGGTAATAVLEVRWDSAGTVESRVARIDGPLSNQTEQRLLSAVVDRLPEVPGEHGGMLISVRGTVGAPLRAGGMEYCTCAIKNRQQFSRALRAAVAELPPGLRDSAPDHTVVLQVRSDSTGRTVDFKLDRLSPYREVNVLLARLSSQLDIAPPLLNRRPSPGWSQLPVTLSFRSR